MDLEARKTRSVVYRTGHTGKVWIPLVCMVIATLLTVTALWQIEDVRGDWQSIVLLLGAGIGIGGFLYSWLSLKCPNCGDRWLWRATSTRHEFSWLKWLLRLEACPNCGFSAARKAS